MKIILIQFLNIYFKSILSSDLYATIIIRHRLATNELVTHNVQITLPYLVKLKTFAIFKWVRFHLLALLLSRLLSYHTPSSIHFHTGIDFFFRFWLMASGIVTTICFIVYTHRNFYIYGFTAYPVAG